jgi:hypothetical protein
VLDDDAIGQQLAQSFLRPPVDEELRDEVEVGTGVDLVGDAGAHGSQDVRGALAADEDPTARTERAVGDRPPSSACPSG